MLPVQHLIGRTPVSHGRPWQSASATGRVIGLRGSLGRSLMLMALALNGLLRDKHEGLNRGNADPPGTW